MESLPSLLALPEGTLAHVLGRLSLEGSCAACAPLPSTAATTAQVVLLP